MEVGNTTPFRNFTREDFETNNLAEMLSWCKLYFGANQYLLELILISAKKFGNCYHPYIHYIANQLPTFNQREEWQRADLQDAY